MATAFRYRPKFVDVRVCKPDAEEAPRRDGERACDHVGCARAGGHKAPKGRGHEGQYWWFCAEHASSYNRSFNYFAGMSAEELSAYAEAEITGHRPTWTFKAGSRDRLFASFRGFERRRADPLDGLHGQEAPAPRAPRVGRLQAMAFETLGLEPEAPAEHVRGRYADLVKRLHPDSNGGDRSTEAQLHRVIRAFQVLRAAGRA